MRLAQSNLGIVVKAHGKLPGSVPEWRKALALTSGGTVNDFLVPFSAAPGAIHLAQPRILMNVSRHDDGVMKHLPTGRGGGGFGSASGLYPGFIYHQGAAAPEVEFISYNRQRRAFADLPEGGLADDHLEPRGEIGSGPGPWACARPGARFSLRPLRIAA
jgi:hypothetical protein